MLSALEIIETLTRRSVKSFDNHSSGDEKSNDSPDFRGGQKAEKTNKINSKKDSWRSLRESNPSFQIENLTS